jgi:hypothetical protein
MKICVRVRTTARRTEPAALCLGGSRLPVVQVLACRDEDEKRCYELAVLDGRRFVIHHDMQANVWQLAAVYARPQPLQASQPVRRPRPRLDRLVAAIRRALRLRPEPHPPVPA